jgi:hypothetical protein
VFYGQLPRNTHGYFYLKTIIVGPPNAPGDVTLTENGVCSLNISWSWADNTRIPVNFTITALNLNNSEESMTIKTQDLLQVISSPNHATACDVYQFQAIAQNPAGVTASDYIFGSFPSLPMPIAEGTVQHFLMKTANDVSLRIVINVRRSNS